MPVNKQDRSIQPSRAGGNCDAYQSEKHQQPKGKQVKQGGGRGELQGSTTGCNKSFGNNERIGGGNDSFGSPSKEMHDQPKARGKHFRAGQLVGEAAKDLMPVQVDDRGRDTAGNCSRGGTEPSGQKKAERVSGKTDRWHE